MIQSPADLYRYVRKAGFPPEAWVPAVALALASSGGEDHFHLESDPPGHLDLRGLFALDVGAHPEWDSWQAFDPQRNTRWAQDWWRRCDGTFDGFTYPVPELGDDRFTLAQAAVATGVTTSSIRHRLPDVPGTALHRARRDQAAIASYLNARRMGV